MPPKIPIVGRKMKVDYKPPQCPAFSYDAHNSAI